MKTPRSRSLHVKKGDLVQVIAGKDKGAKGKIIATYPERERVLVEGVNRITKHTKAGQSARGSRTGGIITQEAPVHVSNVMLVDPEEDRPTRVGFRRETVEKRRPDGTTYAAQRSVRVSKRTGKDV
jgi:large subunit ribosomal protein L24